jgi:hypothetical protein
MRFVLFRFETWSKRGLTQPGAQVCAYPLDQVGSIWGVTCRTWSTSKVCRRHEKCNNDLTSGHKTPMRHVSCSVLLVLWCCDQSFATFRPISETLKTRFETKHLETNYTFLATLLGGPVIGGDGRGTPGGDTDQQTCHACGCNRTDAVSGVRDPQGAHTYLSSEDTHATV